MRWPEIIERRRAGRVGQMLDFGRPRQSSDLRPTVLYGESCSPWGHLFGGGVAHRRAYPNRAGFWVLLAVCPPAHGQERCPWHFTEMGS